MPVQQIRRWIYHKWEEWRIPVPQHHDQTQLDWICCLKPPAMTALVTRGVSWEQSDNVKDAINGTKPVSNAIDCRVSLGIKPISQWFIPNSNLFWITQIPDDAAESCLLVHWSDTRAVWCVSQVPVQIDAVGLLIFRAFYHAILSLLAKGISPQQKL